MAQVEMQCGANRVVSLTSSESNGRDGPDARCAGHAVIKTTTVVVETPDVRKRYAVVPEEGPDLTRCPRRQRVCAVRSP